MAELSPTARGARPALVQPGGVLSEAADSISIMAWSDDGAGAGRAAVRVGASRRSMHAMEVMRVAGSVC